MASVLPKKVSVQEGILRKLHAMVSILRNLPTPSRSFQVGNPRISPERV